MQTHSDVKKYKCLKCAKTFSRMSLLNKHSINCGNGTTPTSANTSSSSSNNTISNSNTTNNNDSISGLVMKQEHGHHFGRGKSTNLTTNQSTQSQSQPSIIDPLNHLSQLSVMQQYNKYLAAALAPQLPPPPPTFNELHHTHTRALINSSNNNNKHHDHIKIEIKNE